YANDCKRHAFPHSRVYFTWYSAFNNIKTVSAGTLASMPLGSNITYHPGVKMVKFSTDNTVYAVAQGAVLHGIDSESRAKELYGDAWNTLVDDINDAFFGDYIIGTPITGTGQYNPANERTAPQSINDNFASMAQTMNIATDQGTFKINLVTLSREAFTMITDAAIASDCDRDCAAITLEQYINKDAGSSGIGIHGTYFCPPDYAPCANKINSFLPPVFNTLTDSMLNEDALRVHAGPLLVQTVDGADQYFHRTKDFGSSVADFESRTGKQVKAAIANYPSLIENSTVIVDTEPMEDPQTTKAVRGGIGYDSRRVYLAIAQNASVENLAYVFKALKVDNAMNLDGGGSAALYFAGSYLVGPGRLLPNAIVFKKR
ncbi:MAG: phosphodiester glycosidase family protein, partial [Patescibacteria group bacterium]